jgi:hypothetical protein
MESEVSLSFLPKKKTAAFTCPEPDESYFFKIPFHDLLTSSQWPVF